MAAQREFRLAIGTPTGRRSTVWKFSVRKSDIYIFSRMFGSDTKVSLHSTGDCQWSATDTWVMKVPGRRNAERHIVKWFMRRPTGASALHVFRVVIPETELRVIDITEDLSAVVWLPAPPRGRMVSIECYITPMSQSDPALLSKLPHPHLFSLPLADGRWFIVLHQVLPDGKDLESLRNQINARAREAGIEPKPEHRASAFTISDASERGLIELCTVRV